MDYDFQPRKRNKQIARRLVKHNNIIVDNIMIPHFNYPEIINSNDLFMRIKEEVNDYDTTHLGVLIEVFRICRYVIGNLNSHLSHLAVLLRKPLVCVDNKITMDNIGIMNPLKTPIIFTNDIKEGMKKYDNTF